jgi:L-fucose mutarotase
MLKGIDPRINADLIYVLAAMGHGDQIAIVDRNYPATSDASSSKLVRYDGVNSIEMLKMILTLMPLDTFVESPVFTMQVVNKPDEILPFHKEGEEICSQVEGRDISVKSLERSDFYAHVRSCFAIVSTSEDRPYGNLILVKGVL